MNIKDEAVSMVEFELDEYQKEETEDQEQEEEIEDQQEEEIEEQEGSVDLSQTIGEDTKLKKRKKTKKKKKQFRVNIL